MSDGPRGGEQSTGSNQAAEVAKRLSDVFEPSRSVYFAPKTWTVEELTGGPAVPTAEKSSEEFSGAEGICLDDGAGHPASERGHTHRTDGRTPHSAPAARQEELEGSEHNPPWDGAEGGPVASGDVLGAVQQFVTRAAAQAARAVRNVRANVTQGAAANAKPLYERLAEQDLTTTTHSGGDEPVIANIVANAPDSGTGAALALARGWGQLIAPNETAAMSVEEVKVVVPAAADGGQPSAATTVASPETGAATASNQEDWTAERKWYEQAVVATQSTRARLFQRIQAAQPELSETEAWRLATKQAYADLNERRPDGDFVPSDHPWDVEYMRQIDRAGEEVRAEHEAALAALEPLRESNGPDAYKKAVAALDEQYNGKVMFDRAVAATNSVLSPHEKSERELRAEILKRQEEIARLEQEALEITWIVAEARGVQPSDLVDSSELRGEPGSLLREPGAARLIARGYAKQVLDARAAAANGSVPVPPSARELARPVTPVVNDRPVNPAGVRLLGRAWSSIIAQRREPRTFVYHPSGSLRNLWLHAAADAAEAAANVAAYHEQVAADPVQQAHAEDTVAEARQDVDAPFPRRLPQIPRIDIPARMQALREHVAAVRVAREADDYVPPAMRQAVADARALYDETRQKFEAALTDIRSDLRGAQLDLSAARDYERAVAVDTQIEQEGLTPEGVAQQAARAAYFTASRKFRSDVLAKAGIEPMGVNFP